MGCNKLFHTDQYGFRPSHSTELAAARLVNKLVVDMDIYKIPTSVLIDLSKHEIEINRELYNVLYCILSICSNTVLNIKRGNQTTIVCSTIDHIVIVCMNYVKE